MAGLSPPQKLDAWDLVILRLLQEDATATIERITTRLGLPAGQASPQVLDQIEARLKKIDAQKLIRAQVALLDRHALGFETIVFTAVRLQTHSQEARMAFEAGVNRCAEIVECFALMGEDDYVLKIILRNSAQFDRFLKQQLLTFTPLADVHSIAVVDIVKATTALPI